jgi:Flavin reductase like domain
MVQVLQHAAITGDEFRYAFRAHPAGVAIVTADDGSGPVAMTVSSVASVSMDPPTLVFSASALSSSTPTITRVDTLVVHLLSAQDIELAKLCAQSGSERFGPLVDWRRGKVTQRVAVNGATLLIVEALEGKPRSEGPQSEPTPLVYHSRKWHTLGERSVMPERVSPFCMVYGRDE